MSIQGVIFDMDGVLVLSEQAHWQSWLGPAERRGVKIDYKTFLSCFGRINPDCIRIMFGPQIPPEESEKIADEKERAFRDIIRQNMPLAPGTVELLTGLKAAGLKLAVGSSGPKANVELVLSAGGIALFFDAYVHGGQVKHGKPAPDVFLLAAESLGLAPEACAVVEDAPAGIAAAVAASMLPVAVTTTHSAADLEAAGAVVIFRDLAAIPLHLFTVQD
jgi:beta-phosphoglucomutase